MRVAEPAEWPRGVRMTGMNLSLHHTGLCMAGIHRLGRIGGPGRHGIGRYIALRTPRARPTGFAPADFDGDLRLGLAAALAAWLVVLAPLVG